MTRQRKIYFIIILCLLYAFEVFIFTEIFIISDAKEGIAYDPIYFKSYLNKALIISLTGLIYPVYSFIKQLKKNPSV